MYPECMYQLYIQDTHTPVYWYQGSGQIQYTPYPSTGISYGSIIPYSIPWASTYLRGGYLPGYLLWISPIEWVER